MGYNSPGPESCRIRNSQTPLTHPCTHMQAQVICQTLHALLTKRTANKVMSGNRGTPFSFPLYHRKEHPHPQNGQLCSYFAGLIFLIQSNDFENRVKIIVTVNYTAHSLPETLFANVRSEISIS